MLVEMYNIAMAATMAIAGLLLTRDYVRFLQSTHKMNALVKSVQHVFSPSSHRGTTKSGYYPVLEYRSEDGPVSFTCIDPEAADRFHIGDKIKLHVSKSRRSHSRNCRTFVALSLMLSLLVSGMLISALVPDSGIGLMHIIIASFVVAVCLFVIVRFKREQDETENLQTLDIENGDVRYCLREPTAFNQWRKSFYDRKQAVRVRMSQVFGACCFVASGSIVVGAILPSII
ncbi:hypothetical protein A3762_03500 [Oleiphilus sp. HI0125]|nr:hypothetical protein A3762_03500 [Oleiphilus sp. HI0125]